MRLLLFDIDGTLIDCGGQTRQPFAEALTEVFGETGAVDRYDFSGKTDTRIVYDLLRGAGRSHDEIWPRIGEVREAYLPRLERGLARERMRLLPGVGELLDALAERSDVTLGLLTGNWERGARIKLSRHDLNRYFRFGSFGDEFLDREELPPVALGRAAERTGRAFGPSETVIIGDAIPDVACARAHGIRCLAVATGKTPGERLEAAGPDRLAADLTPPDLVDWLLADVAAAPR